MTTGGVGMIRAMDSTIGIMTSKSRIARNADTAESKPKPYFKPRTTAKRPACFLCSRRCGWKNRPRPKIVMICVHAALFWMTLASTSGRSSVVTPKARIAMATAKEIVTGIFATRTRTLDINQYMPTATWAQFGDWHSPGASWFKAPAPFTGASVYSLAGDMNSAESLAPSSWGIADGDGLPDDAAVETWPLSMSSILCASSGATAASSSIASRSAICLGPCPRKTGSNGAPMEFHDFVRIKTSWMLATVGRLSMMLPFVSERA
mmetsp:Transcript_71082/g.206119  ORF Transcript_71082/g.206119 Transcript_71082/m.206119 type:complete len:264 (+) Transcript_71082:259-1050(+)